MRCFECGAITHLRHNCRQFLGKAPAKPQASVKRVSACGYYVVDSAHKEHSPVASVCEQSKTVIIILHHCLAMLCHLMRMGKTVVLIQ